MEFKINKMFINEVGTLQAELFNAEENIISGVMVVYINNKWCLNNCIDNIITHKILNDLEKERLIRY